MFLQKLFGLHGKTAAVIGGGGVLAGEISMGLSRAGAKVAVLDIHEENAQHRAQCIQNEDGTAKAYIVDATSKDDLEKTATQIVKDLGPVDILVNAPGINSSTPFFDIEESEWQRILDVNLKSMLLSCQVFAQRMIDHQRRGSIINLSSSSSKIPLSKVFTYGVTKAGVNNLTMFLAREFAPNHIRVNALVPGFFPAEQNRKILTQDRVEAIMQHTPMHRFGEASELVGAVIYLASENASGFVTGSLLYIDGGFGAMTI